MAQPVKPRLQAAPLPSVESREKEDEVAHLTKNDLQVKSVFTSEE